MSKNKGSPRVLGSKAYAAIAAVEGLRLSQASRGRLQKTAKLSQEKRREDVKRSYANKTKRK